MFQILEYLVVICSCKFKNVFPLRNSSVSYSRYMHCLNQVDSYLLYFFSMVKVNSVSYFNFIVLNVLMYSVWQKQNALEKLWIM